MAWDVAVAAFAAMVGAGFVSGREVFVFFAMHGATGALLALGATLLLALGTWRTAQTAPRVPHVAPFWRTLLAAFSFVTLSAVLAAIASLLHARMGLPAPFGGAIAALLAALVQQHGTTSLRRWQGLMLVLVVVTVLLTASLGLLKLPPAALTVAASPLQAVLAVFGYAAYNLALASDGVRRSALGQGVPGRRGAFAGGLAAGLLLTLEAVVLARSGTAIAGADLPLREVALHLHDLLGVGVEVAIALASLSAAASFLQGSADLFGGTWTTAGLAFLLSTLGVQAIVDRAYPAMAAIALLWMLALLWPSVLADRHGPNRQGR